MTNQANDIDPKSNPIISKLYRSREEYLKDRVEEKINRYVKKAFRYRLAYWTMASAAAIGSAVVPVLVNINNVSRIYPTILSLVVVATVALESVFRPREHWRNYDLISSVLREEEMQYSTRTGPYNSAEVTSDVEAFKKFVERVENAIAKERAETIVMRTAAPAAGTGPREPGP